MSLVKMKNESIKNLNYWYVKYISHELDNNTMIQFLAPQYNNIIYNKMIWSNVALQSEPQRTGGPVWPSDCLAIRGYVLNYMIIKHNHHHRHNYHHHHHCFFFFFVLFLVLVLLLQGWVKELKKKVGEGGAQNSFRFQIIVMAKISCKAGSLSRGV